MTFFIGIDFCCMNRLAGLLTHNLSLAFKDEAWCKGYDCGILKDICLKIPRNREGTFTKAGKSECNLRSIVCYIENRLFHLYISPAFKARRTCRSDARYSSIRKEQA